MNNKEASKNVENFKLKGTYNIEFHSSAGIPVATVRFNKDGEQIIGEYDEPGRSLKKLTAIYCDGIKYGWQVASGEKNDEVYTFDLTMSHDDILRGEVKTKFGIIPIVCKKIEESKVIVNLTDLGIEVGVPQGEESPGNPPGKNLVWDPSHVVPMIEKVKPYSKQAKPIAFTGHVSSWLLVAVSWAVQPCTVILYIPEMKISQEMPPLPIGNPDQKGGLLFKITSETKDRIYIEFVVDISDGGTSHSYDSSKLPFTILPPISSDKDLFISGNGPNLIPVAMGLGYAKIAKSISFRYHTDPYYICAISNNLARPVGFVEMLTPD